MKANFEKLKATEHMLRWFSEKPFEQIISTVESMFRKQSASTQMLRFEIISEPQWLTAGKETSGGTKVLLVRSGVAAACSFTLQDDNGTYNLEGIFTWVGADLDNMPKTNMWIDINGTLEEFGNKGLLMLRIYELDS